MQFVDAVWDAARSSLPGRQNLLRRFERLLTRLAGANVFGLQLPPTLARHWKTLLENLFADFEQLDGKSLVFLWDEVPYMLQSICKREGEAVARELLDTLRNIRQERPRARMVFTGSIGLHHVLRDLREKGLAHAPVNDMKVEIVPPLDDEAATELAARLLLGAHLASPGEALAAAPAIAAAVDDVPYYIHHVVGALAERGLAPAPANVERVVHDALGTPHDPWDLGHYERRLADYYGARRDLAADLLDLLASHDAPRAEEQIQSELGARGRLPEGAGAKSMLDDLTRDHYLAFENGRYGFFYPLIKRWWRTQRSL